jgi:hypothetical protein
VEDAMTKLIRIAIGALTLSGALALLPGVAQASVGDRPAPAEVGHDRDGRHDRDARHERDWRRDRDDRARHDRDHRDHDGRRDGHDGRPRR